MSLIDALDDTRGPRGAPRNVVPCGDHARPHPRAWAAFLDAIAQRPSEGAEAAATLPDRIAVARGAAAASAGG